MIQTIQIYATAHTRRWSCPAFRKTNQARVSITVVVAAAGDVAGDAVTELLLLLLVLLSAAVTDFHLPDPPLWAARGVLQVEICGLVSRRLLLPNPWATAPARVAVTRRHVNG